MIFILSHSPLKVSVEKKRKGVAAQLIDSCLKQGARTIIVDIGNKFDAVLQAVSNKHDVFASDFLAWCYYDNPEPYVPGGYSIKTGETIKASRHILFANRNLAKSNSNIYYLPDKIIDLTNKTVEGLGYYPVIEAEKLSHQRAVEQVLLRTQHGWSSVNHLFVYFGGNNDEYFEKAFPAFLSSLSQVEKTVFQDVLLLLHQHPAAKKNNRDGLLLQEWMPRNNHIRIAVSPLKTSDQAQIVADGAVYYQTSMAPQFALIGLPTMQVGHEVYRDVLVKHNLCYTATNATELASGLRAMKSRSESSDEIEQRKYLIYNAIGYTAEWLDNLRHLIFDLE